IHCAISREILGIQNSLASAKLIAGTLNPASSTAFVPGAQVAEELTNTRDVLTDVD
ncbi:hypothetical protein JYU34_011536, partial [Plutella xylostella]